VGISVKCKYQCSGQHGLNWFLDALLIQSSIKLLLLPTSLALHCLATFYASLMTWITYNLLAFLMLLMLMLCTPATPPLAISSCSVVESFSPRDALTTLPWDNQSAIYMIKIPVIMEILHSINV